MRSLCWFCSTRRDEHNGIVRSRFRICLTTIKGSAMWEESLLGSPCLLCGSMGGVICIKGVGANNAMMHPGHVRERGVARSHMGEVTRWMCSPHSWRITYRNTMSICKESICIFFGGELSHALDLRCAMARSEASWSISSKWWMRMWSMDGRIFRHRWRSWTVWKILEDYKIVSSSIVLFREFLYIMECVKMYGVF